MKKADLISGDFEDNTMTFKIEGDMILKAGKYTIYTDEENKNLSLSGVVDRLPQDPIILARYLHEAYEMLAKNNDWNTQENCKVDFSDLPIGNKNTMILLAGKLILDFGGN